MQGGGIAYPGLSGARETRAFNLQFKYEFDFQVFGYRSTCTS